MRYIILLIGLLFTCQVHAQQLPLFSQYNQNNFILNPGMTGMDESTTASVTLRRQWQQMPQAPETGLVSFRTYLDDYGTGIGGYILADKTGPTSFISLNGSYAYHIDFDRWNTQRLALGLSFSLAQYRLKGSELVLDEADDIAIFTNNVSRILPDAGLGATYYTDDFYVGISIPQAVSLNVRFDGDDGISSIRRIAHFYAMGGIKIITGAEDHIELEPSIWLKYAPHSPIHANLNFQLTYDNIIGMGIGYATDKTALGQVNVMIAERLRLGYAFSVQFSEWTNYLGGTHEIGVNYVIDSGGVYGW